VTFSPDDEPVREPGYSDDLLPPHALAAEPVRRMSGPAHYAEAGRYAGMAVAAVSAGDPATAAVLAAIGQLHATLAVAAATALHDEHADIREWRNATGQA